MKKQGFEFSFAWLFAILAGIFILFLAIYAASRFIKTGQYQVSTVTAKQLSIIFEPMETGLASGKSSVANLREETRIYNKCSPIGTFGKHRISLATKGFGKKWKEPGGEISVPNKYLFSEDVVEGKKIYFSSMPFEMPWKVSEIIFLTSEKYCFVNAPDEIESNVKIMSNIKFENCSNEIKVCFSSTGDCDINVIDSCFDCDNEYEYGYVEKQGERMFYTGNLLYGAIFASPEIYECNVKRLVKRLREQALLYKDEADFLSSRCKSLPASSLLQLANVAKISEVEDLLLIRTVAEEVDEQNSASECSLW